MHVTATKSPETESSRRDKSGMKSAPLRALNLMTGRWGDPSFVQRKAHCACGGGCPRCAGEHRVEPKLAINTPGDLFEREADRIADAVIGMQEPAASGAFHRVAGFGLQRGGSHEGNGPCPECESEQHGELQRASRRIEPPQAIPPIVGDVLRSAGQPLDARSRDFFESRLGHDFSQVRIHTDGKAAESAQAVRALAYTVGRDIVFGSGQYATGSKDGQKLLAHELVHTIQQADGRMQYGAYSLHLQRDEMDGTSLEQSDSMDSIASSGSTPGPAPIDGDKSDCSGWKNDPQSLSITASQHYRRTKLGLGSGSAVTVTPAGCGMGQDVTYSDGVVIRVEWGAGCPFCSLDGGWLAVRQISPTSGPRCCYDATCPPSGGIILTGC